jgi:hypothetical protein
MVRGEVVDQVKWMVVWVVDERRRMFGRELVMIEKCEASL